MKTKIINNVNIEVNEISSFAYVICQEIDNKLFTPVYNKYDRVISFSEIWITDKTELKPIEKSYKVKVGDSRIYAYYHNGKVYTGNKYEISRELKKLLLKDDTWLPFSKLDVVEFLNSEGVLRDDVLKDCYRYLKEISPEYAAKWAESMNFNINEIPVPAADEYIKRLALGRKRRYEKMAGYVNEVTICENGIKVAVAIE